MKSKIILIVAILVSAFALPTMAAQKSSQQKPNILVIWGDDIGIANISFNNRGMMGYQTPNIDRIAKEGWREQGVVPRGVDREVVEALHRTHIGDDQDPEHILNHAIRTGLADGWGGSMIATDFADILFGTPPPILGQANLGVLKDDMVNVVVHGHEPTLSQMIVAATQDPEIIEYAKNAGAKGVNLSGICCTANEILMRQGVPAAGNFLHQELAILTGAVEAMVVDVQCIMQALVDLATNFHTMVITTSPKVRIKGATHIEFDEHKDGSEVTLKKVRMPD